MYCTLYVGIRVRTWVYVCVRVYVVYVYERVRTCGESGVRGPLGAGHLYLNEYDKAVAYLKARHA